MSIQHGKTDERLFHTALISESVYQTRLGHYFIGQTGLLTLGGGAHAWGGLFNPNDSGINLFLDAFTITNYLAEPFTVEVWLNNSSLGKGMISRHVASANQAMRPTPIPKVELRDADRLQDPPKDGLFSFVRIAEPKATVSGHGFHNMMIVPPGGSIIAFLRSSEAGTIRSRMDFGWWEDAVS